MPDPVVNRESRYIPVASPSIGKLEYAAVADCLDRGQLSGGDSVGQFERLMAESHGCAYGVACNSGSTAIHLALVAAGVRVSDYVACPTMTMVAVANAIVTAGAQPLFIDSEPSTGNMDLGDLEKTISRQRYRPRAIIYPHLYGVPIEFRTIPGVIAIEDCAEAHFARFSSGGSVGGRGDFATFSFYANKIIGCGEGGMVTTNDAGLSLRLRSLRAHAFTPGEHFTHRELAFGYRMTELQGAIGCAQFTQREYFLSRRTGLAERYLDRLAGLPWLTFPKRTPGSVWWVFPILCDTEARRTAVRKTLAEAGIETRTYFKLLHSQNHLRRYSAPYAQFPVANDLAARGLYLPLYPSLQESDVDFICDTIRGCV